jgi:hypothetical protein
MGGATSTGSSTTYDCAWAALAMHDIAAATPNGVSLLIDMFNIRKLHSAGWMLSKPELSQFVPATP